MNQFEAKIKKIEELDAKLMYAVDEVLTEAMLECFKYWAKRFPKRRLYVIFGMGTYSYDTDAIDLNDFIDHDRRKRYGYREVYEDLFKPFIDFDDLLWSSDMYKYPAINDFLYNPITKTIEYSGNIINTEEL